MRKPKQRKPNDLSRSLAALDVDHTLIAVVEMSLSGWLVAGIVPGVERQPLKKLKTDACALLELLHRWRAEAVRAGHKITRIAVAFEAGRDGFWLARWLKARGIEAHVIHASSIAVSREHRRAKTDRLDTDLLKRSFLGWLRGERDHCKTVAAQHFGRAQTRHGAPSVHLRSDPQDRAGAHRTSGADAQYGTHRHGSPAGARHRHWHRDRRLARARGTPARLA